MTILKKYITLICALLLVVSCTNNDFNEVGSSVDGKEAIMLSLNLPVPSTLVTRADDQLELVNRINGEPLVYLFSKDRLIAEAKIEKKSTLNYLLWIKSEVSAKTDKIVVIANTAELANRPTVGDNYQDILDGYTFAYTQDLTSGIPMWGEVEYSANLKTVNISLQRSVASIDVLMAKDMAKFEFLNLYLYNYNEIGHVGHKKLSELESTPATKALSFKPENGTSVEHRIYIPEVAVPKEGEEPVVLIVEGNYDGKHSFYRIDFLDSSATGAQLKYLPLKRNYKYKFNVLNVFGDGWPSLELALKNKQTTSLEYQLVTWQAGIAEMWEQNGKYLALPNRHLAYSVFTNEENPEVLSCQTNLNADDFKFESKYFNYKFVRDSDDDVARFEFYPVENIDQLLAADNINIDEKEVSGKLFALGDAFNYDIYFKRMGDYLEVYDIDVDLYGKYQVDYPTSRDEHYVDITVKYKAERYAALRYKSLGEGNESDLGFEGVIEFFPDQAVTKARLYAYGTPKASKNKEAEAGFKIYTFDFGKIHKNSPIKKLDINVDVLKKDELRTTKILFVTPNGGDYTALFSFANEKAFFGKEGYNVKARRGFDVQFSAYFPINDYNKYHVIYYFDSASVKESSINENEDKDRGNKATTRATTNDTNRFAQAVKKYVDNGGVLIYCSDKRNIIKESGGWLGSTKYKEEISAETIDESNDFFSVLLDNPLYPKLKVKEFIAKEGWLGSDANNKVYESKDYITYTSPFKFGILEDDNATHIQLLMFPHNADKRNFEIIKRDFDIDYFTLGNLSNTKVYHPISLRSKTKSFAWMGTPRLFIEASFSKDSSGAIKISEQGVAYRKLLEWAFRKADDFKDFNRVNKARNFMSNEDGYTLSFTYN